MDELPDDIEVLKRLVLEEREAKERERSAKEAALALSEQAVYHAIRVLENTDWSLTEQLASLWGIMDGLHATKLRLAWLQDPEHHRSIGHLCGAGASEMVHSYAGQTDTYGLNSRATPTSGDPHQVDADAWFFLRADPMAKRLRDLYVRLQLVLALRAVRLAA